jgi:hypothetical protein
MSMRNSRFFVGIFYTLAVTSVLLLGARSSQAYVDVGVSINIAPPELPVYAQPPVPGPGYLWTPGYWAWGDSDYYWVPGTWVEAPQPGYLWTPGYWGWNDGLYVWNGGYWGEHIGFYGGVNYGYGYGGRGYDGGYWDHGAFRYNSAYSNVNNSSVHITNVYNKTVINNNTTNHVSFNGGHGGIQARPAASELAAQHEQHLPPVAAQQQHVEAARANPALRAAANHGRPPVAATARPGVFTGQGVVAAHAAASAHPTTFTGTQKHAAVAPAHAAEPAHAAPPHAAAAPAVTAPHGGEPEARVEHSAPPQVAAHQGGAGAAPPRPQQHEAPHEAPREEHEERPR